MFGDDSYQGCQARKFSAQLFQSIQGSIWTSQLNRQQTNWSVDQETHNGKIILDSLSDDPIDIVKSDNDEDFIEEEEPHSDSFVPVLSQEIRSSHFLPTTSQYPLSSTDETKPNKDISELRVFFWLFSRLRRKRKGTHLAFINGTKWCCMFCCILGNGSVDSSVRLKELMLPGNVCCLLMLVNWVIW